MRNDKIKITKLAKSIAERALYRNANSTTCISFYQPPVPVKLACFKEKAKEK